MIPATLLLCLAAVLAQEPAPAEGAPQEGPPADDEAPLGAPPPMPHHLVPHVEVPHHPVAPDDPPPGAPDEPPPPAEPGLTRGPLLLHDVVPAYPQTARDQGIQGDVLLQLEILEDGRIGAVELLQAPHELLAWPSIEAAPRAAVPARPAGGHPHRRHRHLPLQVRPRSGG
ncbi:MAG: TonB family protein [Pseudomonadota bacterium]